MQVRLALDESCKERDEAAAAHDQTISAMRAQLSSLQEHASQAQAELRAEKAKVERLQEEASLAQQGVIDLEASLQAQQAKHEAAASEVHPDAAICNCTLENQMQ